MKITKEYLKQQIMLQEQKLELYKTRTDTNCPVIIAKLEKELDSLYESLLNFEDEAS
jgi:hypothetical protein